MTEISLCIPKPFDFRRTVQKPAGWHWGTPFERFEDGVLYTALRLPGNQRLVGLKLWQEDAGRSRNNCADIHVKVSGRVLSRRDAADLSAMLELGFGLHDDLRGFYRLAAADPLVARLKKDLHGLRMGFPVDVFERCLLAITLQMAPMRRSAGMRACLIERYGDMAQIDGRRIRYWPSAGAIAAAPAQTMMKECVLGYRAKAIHRVAEAIVAGFPNIIELSRMEGSEMRAKISTLYGLGPYSAQIVSPDGGFPLDVWSARVFYEIIHGATPPEPRKMIRQLEEDAERRWGPYKRHVFVYVLNDLPNLLNSYPITKMT